MNMRPSPLSPEIWINNIFGSKAAAAGAVIRRKSRDVERFVGREAFRQELDRRGFQAIENAGQIIIFCNQEEIRRFR